MIGECSVGAIHNKIIYHLKTVSAFVLVCCVLCTATDGLDQYLNPEWIEPHAWGNEKDPLQQLCPQASVATCDKQCDKRNLEIAFKKFVHIIFGRDKFKVRVC